MRAYAVGLHRLGLKRGDTMAIVGSNRPRLYCFGDGGAGARRRFRCRSMPTRSPTNCPIVLAHAEVRFAAVEDQEQVDKILSVSDRLPKLETDGL